MANVMRAVRKNKISATFTLATADDLDGTTDGTQYLNVPKGARVLIIQHNNGTDGTAGVDVIEISIAGGAFHLDPTLLAVADPDVGGTLLAALNAAGTEPTNMAAFKSGPFSQDVRLRCGRKTTDTGGTTWVDGAPSVTAYLIK
jgi:hypothetical protein